MPPARPFRIGDPDEYLDALEAIQRCQASDQYPDDNAEMATLDGQPCSPWIGCPGEDCAEPALPADRFDEHVIDVIADNLACVDLTTTDDVFTQMHVVADDEEICGSSEDEDDEVTIVPIVVEDTDDGTPSLEDETSVHDFMQTMEKRAKRRRVRVKGPSPSRMFPRTSLSNAAMARGIPKKAFQSMLVCGMPMLFLNLLVFLEAVFPRSSDGGLDMAELFSGVGHVHEAFLEKDFAGAVYDIHRHSLFEDVLSSEGYLTLVRTVRNVKPGGVTHWATVCSSWIYLSRASSGRSASRPLGFKSVGFVREANKMMARVSLLLVFCTCMHIYFVHEQPVTSLAPLTKYMIWAKAQIRNQLKQTWRELFTPLPSIRDSLCSS